MNKYLYRELRIVAVLFLPVLVLILFWDEIPAQIPVQWSLEGNPLSYQPKYILPFINIGIYYLLLIKTILTTDNYHFDLSIYSYYKLRLVVFIILSYINVLLLMFGAGYDINSSNIMFLSFFFILVIISEYIKDIGLFSPIKIIIPQALKNKIVRAYTHKFTSLICFWLALLGILLNIIAGYGFTQLISLLIVGLIMVSPIVISFYFYRYYKGDHLFQN